MVLSLLLSQKNFVALSDTNQLNNTEMNIFSTILAKLFPANHPAVNTPANPAAPAATPAPTAATATAPSVAPPAVAPSAPAAALAQVDVEKVLNDRAMESMEKLNWRTSIVDLMKLLDMDSGLENRRSLAKELGFSGDMNDSAAMNVWLHKAVMRKVSQNGGRVPKELLD